MTYKGSRLEARSYENPDTQRWVPVVFIFRLVDPGAGTYKTLTELDHEQPSKSEADDYALARGKAWIDAGAS